MPRRNEVLEYFKQYVGCQELVQVEETDSPFARHICTGVKKIQLLPKLYLDIPTNDEMGFVHLEYYQCMNCGKVVLNRNFM